MPSEETIEKARQAEKEGASPSTQAGEFVREEIRHVREGKHGARSPQQAIAIGLSKARRAGVKLPPPNPATTSSATRRRAQLDSRKSGTRRKTSGKRSRATKAALKREGKGSVSARSLARHARGSASRRTRANRKAAARKAAKTRASRARRRK